MNDKRKCGGQPGNQNAYKHGFYSKKLTPAQQASFADAAAVEGVDDEITILRLKISSLVANDPDNNEALVRAVSALSRLLNTRHKLGYDHKKKLLQAVANVVRDIGGPLMAGLAQSKVEGLVRSKDEELIPNEAEELVPREAEGNQSESLATPETHPLTNNELGSKE